MEETVTLLATNIKDHERTTNNDNIHHLHLRHQLNDSLQFQLPIIVITMVHRRTVLVILKLLHLHHHHQRCPQILMVTVIPECHQQIIHFKCNKCIHNTGQIHNNNHLYLQVRHHLNLKSINSNLIVLCMMVSMRKILTKIASIFILFSSLLSNNLRMRIMIFSSLSLSLLFVILHHHNVTRLENPRLLKFFEILFFFFCFCVMTARIVSLHRLADECTTRTKGCYPFISAFSFKIE